MTWHSSVSCPSIHLNYPHPSVSLTRNPIKKQRVIWVTQENFIFPLLWWYLCTYKSFTDEFWSKVFRYFIVFLSRLEYVTLQRVYTLGNCENFLFFVFFSLFKFYKKRFFLFIRHSSRAFRFCCWQVATFYDVISCEWLLEFSFGRRNMPQIFILLRLYTKYIERKILLAVTKLFILKLEI